MKKAKRFLTGLLSAALALSLCAMPAMAEDVANEDNNASATLSSIDTTKTGSITIYKYTYNGTEPAENRKGTGETTDANKVPSEGEDKATPLSGVTFTAYQVMNAEQLINYYDSVQNNKVATVKISDYVTNNQIIESKVVEKDTDGKIVSHSQETQEPDGKAVIGDLKVGLYAVVETKHPAGVTVVTPAFLVSIPMTKQSTTAKDSPKSDWMYDVTVYPKNQTAAAPITLQKQGKTGGENTTLTNEMEGYEFKLEKWDTEKGWIIITAASKDGKDNAGDAIGKTNEKGQITIKSLTPGIYRFTEVSAPANSPYIVDKETHYLFKVTTDGTIATVTNDEIPNDANNNFDAVDADGKIVTIVNNKPDLEKKVKNTEDAEKPFGEAADYSAGDLVPYQITVKVPENIAKLKTFTVTDTPTGLKDKKDTIKIVCNNKTLAENGSITNTEVVKSINETNNGGFEIEFIASAMQTYAGQNLVITYEAELLGKDDNSTAVTNPNSAKLTYTNVIETTETPDQDDSTKTVEDETIVYSFELTINKIGDDDKKLEGVKFDLYKQVKENTQGSITGKQATDLGLDGSKSWLKVDTLTTGTDGVITKTGLANGTYYLVETKTNEGYNLLSKPVEVVLNKEFTKHWQQVTNTDESGNVTHHEWETLVEIKEANATEVKQPSKSITVINRKGFDLPVTGGFGTLLFSGIGVLLVVAGVGVLLSLKKKNRA